MKGYLMKLIVFSNPKLEETSSFTERVTKLKQKYKNSSEVEIMDLDVAQNKELCVRYKIEKLPAMIFEEKGIIKRKLEGDVHITEIEKYLTQV